MDKCDIIHIFYEQETISYDKKIEDFEKVYEELKDKLHLKRKEIDQVGWTLVVITKEG